MIAALSLAADLIIVGGALFLLVGGGWLVWSVEREIRENQRAAREQFLTVYRNYKRKP